DETFVIGRTVPRKSSLSSLGDDVWSVGYFVHRIDSQWTEDGLSHEQLVSVWETINDRPLPPMGYPWTMFPSVLRR
ncbi:MAG: hypothetical protein AAF078_10065, partial [Planctomycetota bacterium]